MAYEDAERPVDFVPGDRNGLGLECGLQHRMSLEVAFERFDIGNYRSALLRL
jgi:hypothetical protein